MLNYQNELKLLFWRMHNKITLRITINNVPSNITVSKDIHSAISVNPNIEWKGDKEMFVGPGAMLINTQLFKFKSEVQQVYSLPLGYHTDTTSAIVSNVYKLMSVKKYPANFDGVRQCFQEMDLKNKRFTLVQCVIWLREFKKNIEKLEPATVETYATRIKNLELFLEHIKSKDLLAEKFTPGIATQFCDWMRGRQIARNHVARHIMFFKEALKECETRELIACNPLNTFTYSKEERDDIRHLEYEELQTLDRLDLSDHNIRLRHSRDMFVFCCYTGFHYCDREGLKLSDLREINGNHWIFKTRQKTKRFDAEAKVKLHPRAVAIIEMYKGIDNLPRLDNSETNYDLKILEKMIGVSYGLSTKIARKTFTHLCLNHWLIDSDTTSAMMGLKSIKHIKKYGKVNEKRIESMVNWQSEL